jgi:DNA replication protein
MQRQSQDNAVTVLMSSGFIAIPGILLREYKRLGLNDHEMMLLLHLIQFRQEGIGFPTAYELSERMSLHANVITSVLQQLMEKGFLDIEVTGEGYEGEESLSLKPLYYKLSQLLEPKPVQKSFSSYDLLEKREQNLFALFEQEFARPLSPIEYERITSWVDKENYREELIREALREAVLAGKFNFRYIDRILFEWQKNNIRSLQDLNNYREQFRNRIPTRGQNYKSAGNTNKTTADAESGNKYDVFYKVYGGNGS